MVKMILSSSVIFLAIVAIRTFFRGKVGNLFLYSLWLLFASSLVVPLLLAVLQDVTRGERGKVESPISIMNLVKTPSINDDTASISVLQKGEVAGKGEQWQKRVEEIEKKVGEGASANGEMDKEQSESNGLLGWFGLHLLKLILFFIWAVGTITILSCQYLLERSFRKRLAKHREEINYQGQKAYMACEIKTPLLFRGKGLTTDIYLPETIMGNETLVSHAILHETVHRRHGDIWWGYLRNFLVAVYWFYPLVWVAAILSKRDCEYACDSSVMKGMSRKECIAYGNSLLSLIQVGGDRDLFRTATAMKIGKSEMEVRIRMIKRGKKRSILTTVFILLLLCFTGVVTFTDAMERDKMPAKEQEMISGRQEQKESSSAKEAEYKLTDIWGADEPYIYYEDNAKMIFAGYFGLFVYSKETEEIVQSIDLKEIGCNMTQGDHYCEINVSEDGKTVYLHVKRDEKMYQYSVDTGELQYLDYKLPDKLYNRKKWEKENPSGIKPTGSTIGDLVYWYEDGMMIKYQPLFYKPYGSCGFYKPEDIRYLKEVSFYANGKEWVISEEKKLKWIEKRFSNLAEEIQGGSACPFYHIMYLKRKDGSCGKIFPATDSCSVYLSEGTFYDYKEKTNKEFWELFGIKDMDSIK